MIGSSVLQRGKAGCSSLPRTEVLFPCQAGGEEGQGQSPVLGRNGCTPGPIPALCLHAQPFPLQQTETMGLLKVVGLQRRAGWC